MIKFFKKRKYKVKYFLYFVITWVDLDNIDETITYILLENGYSKRKVEFESYGNCRRFHKEESTELYLKVILPWLNNIDKPLKGFIKRHSSRVVEHENNETVTVEQKNNILYINRDK